MKIYTKYRILNWVKNFLKFPEPIMTKEEKRQLLTTKVSKLLSPEEYKYLVTENYIDKTMALDISSNLLAIHALKINVEYFHTMGVDKVKITAELKYVMP